MLIIGPVLAQLVGAWTGVSAGWLGLFFGFALTWVMQVTTHQAGLDSPSARLALAQRIALAALAIFLMLNAVTPFITPDPPWLTKLPLMTAVSAVACRDR